MPLPVNAKAPDFTLPSTGDKFFKLSENAAEKPIILYFYPRDFTPGCTKEACSFRDNFEPFRTLKIKIVGISTDPVEVHESFKEKFNLPFELLSDPHGRVCKAYKAKIPFLNIATRVTYLLDKNHKIAAVYSNLFGAEKHIEKMIKDIGMIT